MADNDGIPRDGWIVPQAFDRNEADEKMPLGTTFVDARGNVFVYFAGVAANVAGDACSLQGSHTVVRMLTAEANKLYPVGIARSAFVASEFGFVQVVGRETGGGVSVLLSAAAEVAMYSTGTAGALDDTVTTLIRNMVLATAQGGAPGINTSAIYIYPSPT